MFPKMMTGISSLKLQFSIENYVALSKVGGDNDCEQYYELNSMTAQICTKCYKQKC